MQRWTTAFVRSLKVHLREGRGDLANELKDILRPEELGALLKAPHRPIFAMQVLGETIRATKMDPVMKGMMDNNLTAYEDAVGGCERILRTPLPLTYTRHTTRFLVRVPTMTVVLQSLGERERETDRQRERERERETERQRETERESSQCC